MLVNFNYTITFEGTAFCPSKNNSRVAASVFYRDFGVTNVVEVEAYPLDEMLNELAGIGGLYFDFSIITIAVLLTTGIQMFQKARIERSKGKEIPMVSNLETIIR